MPSVECSLAAQLQDLEILTTAETNAAGARAYVVEYDGTKDDVRHRYKHLIFMVDEGLFSIACRAGLSEFGEVEPEFDEILDSVSVTSSTN